MITLYVYNNHNDESIFIIDNKTQHKHLYYDELYLKIFYPVNNIVNLIYELHVVINHCLKFQLFHIN